MGIDKTKMQKSKLIPKHIYSDLSLGAHTTKLE